MSLVSSKTLLDKHGYSWRILSDGQNSVWQRSMPVPSDSISNFQFATFGGSIPPEIISQALDLNQSDYSSAEESQNVPVEYIFKSGLTTCDLPSFESLEVSDLRNILIDVKHAWDEIDKLCYLECSLVQEVYYRTEKVLNENHSIVKPVELTLKSQSDRLEWYLDATK